MWQDYARRARKNRKKQLFQGFAAPALVLSSIGAHGIFLMLNSPTSPVKKKYQGRGRKRPNTAVTLPTSIFVTLRAVGVSDRDLSKALGIPRQTLTRVCSGNADKLDLSLDEFARLKAFCAERLAGAEAAAALLQLWAP